MQAERKQHGNVRKRTSVSATVLFVALSVLLVYGAVHWMGDTVVRFLSAPQPSAPPAQTPFGGRIKVDPTLTPSAPQTTPTGQPALVQNANAAGTTAVPSDTPPILTNAAPTTTEVPAQEAGTWRQGVRHTARFEETQMDAVLVLTNARGKVLAVSLLSLRDGETVLLAVPANCITESGMLLNSYASEKIASALSDLLPVTYEHYLVLPIDLIRDALGTVGEITVAGRRMDGAAAEAYLSEAIDAPLLCAERFSHVLSALPERIRSLSMLKLLRIKADLTDAVKTNISVSDGWMLCNALRVLNDTNIMEHTLPVTSVSVAAGRAYRPQISLAEPILEKMYGRNEKSSEKTS